MINRGKVEVRDRYREFIRDGEKEFNEGDQSIFDIKGEVGIMEREGVSGKQLGQGRLGFMIMDN